MKSWMDNVKEWTTLPIDELLSAAHNRPDWWRISVSSTIISPQRPKPAKGLMMMMMITTVTTV
ncbi:hypothetical protein DPMN_194600 [Dreissena polymorpha]|uniref:Uncharacterized protein n=1 Tax=Dreissena polymorpha TaxID=45954 RepID=A0A9D4BEY8_DREPO|nr:hypothetical protein DPMN_194600 [Dreissena polymorpha]